MSEINTANDSLVAVQGDMIVLLVPRTRFTKEQALRCAAWMAALADDNDEFEVLLTAVKNT